jgi:uncharacterized DUF497 family protein
MKTRFTWDVVKAAHNLKKHGLSFETAVLAFSDPFQLTEQDRVENAEERWQTLGIIEVYLLVLVAHTVWNEEDGTELVRIISARRATLEEKRYERKNRYL